MNAGEDVVGVAAGGPGRRAGGVSAGAPRVRPCGAAAASLWLAHVVIGVVAGQALSGVQDRPQTVDPLPKLPSFESSTRHN